MNKKDKIKTLWDTHRFLEDRIVALEEEYTMLLYDAKVYCLQSCLKNGITNEEIELHNIDDFIAWTEEYNSDGALNISKDILERDVNRTITELETYYVKQVNTLDEIEKFYDEERFSLPEYGEEMPPGAPIECITELSTITKQLLEAHRESSERLLLMIEDGNSI